MVILLKSEDSIVCCETERSCGGERNELPLALQSQQYRAQFDLVCQLPLSFNVPTPTTAM